MFPVLAKYNIYLSGESYGCMGEAVFREWREPDGFGDPGRVVRRELLQIVIGRYVYTEPRPVHHGRKLSIRTATLAKQPVWEQDE